MTAENSRTPVAGRRVAVRYLTLSGANVAAMGLGFAAMLVIVHHFGAEGLGRAALAQSILAYALTVALCGTDLFAIQRVAAIPELLWTTVRAVRRARGIAALVAYLGMLALTVAVPAFRDVTMLVALFGLSLFAIALTPEWVPQAQHRTGVTAVANLSTQAIYLSIVAAATLWSAGLWSVAAAKVCADVVVMAGLLVWLSRSSPATGHAPPLRDVWQIIREASPISATQLVRSVSITSDIVILGFMVSRADLGHYSGAARLFTLLLTLATSYFVILLPRFAERASSPRALEEELNASLRSTIPIALGALLLLAVLSGPILHLLFGADFSDATMALRFLGGAAAANLIGRHYRQILLVRGQQTTDFHVTLGGAAVHLIAKVSLIPLLGITGAAIGALLGEGFMMLAHRQTGRLALRATAPVPAHEGAGR